MSGRAVIAAAAALAGCAVFVLAPAGEERAAWRAASILIAVLGIWVTQALPEYFGAVVFFLLAVTLGEMPADVVFSGFHASATWMIFGGLIIGYCVQETGLGVRVAAGLMRGLAQSYLGILATATALSAAMAFLAPSNTGRILIMVPIFLALADRFGFAPGSNGRAGLALAVAGGTVYPSFAILPAAVPNLIVVGGAEGLYGLEITYADYLLRHFPVIGLVSLIALPLILRFLLPDRPGEHPPPGALPRPQRGEVTLGLLLILALGLWITDFAHGVKPAWVALGVALLCLLPRVDIAEAEAMVTKINFGPWLYVAAVIGVGAVVAESGLGKLLAAILLDALPLAPGADALNLAVVAAIGAVMNLVATVPGQPAIMTALAADIAEAAGWPLATALHAQAVTWAMTLFPYQLPPLMVAAALAGIDFRHLVRLQAAMFAVAWLAMLPLLYVWWRMLGLFG